MAHTHSTRKAKKRKNDQCKNGGCVSFVWENSKTRQCWWHDPDGKETFKRNQTVQDIKIRKQARIERIKEKNRRDTQEEIKLRRQKFSKGKASKGKHKERNKRRAR